MRVTITSRSENMGDETGTIAIERLNWSEIKIGRWVDENWGPAGAHDISEEQLRQLCKLAYGQTLWVPEMSRAVYRFTGDLHGLDFCENSPRAPGTLYFDSADVMAAVEQVLSVEFEKPVVAEPEPVSGGGANPDGYVY